MPETSSTHTIESDLVGSHGYYTDGLKVLCRIRSVYFKPKMCVGQILEYQGPYFLVQNADGVLHEYHHQDFIIDE